MEQRYDEKDRDIINDSIKNYDEQIEDQRMQLEAERAQFRAALTENAWYSYTLDLDDGYFREEIYDYSGQPIIEELGLELPAYYDEVARRYKEKYRIVFANSKDASIFSLEGLRASFLESKRFSIEYQMTAIDKTVNSLVLLAEDPVTGHLIYNAAAFDITEKVQEEQARQRMLMDAYMVTAALTEEYVNTFRVNPDNNSFEILKFDSRSFQNIQAKSFSEYNKVINDFDETISAIFRSSSPSEAEANETINAININRILNELEKKDYYIVNYRQMVNETLTNQQAKFIKLSDGRIIMAIRNVDDILQREKQQREFVEDALAQAKNANRAKTIFLNNMSHDIRTPMNAIIGYTTLALNNLEDKNKVNDYLNKINISSNHLLSLINNVLDMSRIEAGKFNVEVNETSIDDVIREIRTIVLAELKKHNLNHSFEIKDLKNTRILCDRLRLNQVLLNCISNAIKFTPANGRVDIILSQLPSDRAGYGKYEFIVRDTGIGMSKEFAEHIFEPFSREQNSTGSGIQGTGLGMSITKNIVDMMGGEISVTSKKGEGTELVIKFSFPLVGNNIIKKKNTSVTLKNDNTQKENILMGVKILLVEDNELNREIAEEILSEYGALIEIAIDGSEAVEIISNSSPNRFDLVLMDVQMPVMDGYTATKSIRSLEDAKKASIPIIAMTANAFEEDKKLAYDAGMNSHVSKPINVEQLIDEIKKIIND